MKEDIQNQLSVGFLLVVEYPKWLANVVHVPKKDGKVRVCVDFRNLNKVGPKDDFPPSHIDMLIDSTTGHSMLSFMDGFFWVQLDSDCSKGHGEDVLHYSVGYLLLQSYVIRVEECRSYLSKSNEHLLS